MKKRLLACVLSLSLIFNLSVPALASDLEDTSSWEVIHVPESFDYSSLEDIEVNPEDYILGSGVAAGSLGVTLSIGHIAALIAAGGGVVFATQYLDDLGRHLSANLNAAAASIPNGTQILTQWLVNCYQGTIKLKSAADWIAQTITDTIHGYVTNSSPLPASYYSSTGYAPPASGSVVPAGSHLYIGSVSVSGSDGSISRDYMTADFDMIPFTFVSFDDYRYSVISVAMKSTPGTDGYYYTSNGSSTKLSSQFGYTPERAWIYTCSSNGIQRAILPTFVSNYGTFSSTAHRNAFLTYVVPGSIVVPSGTSINKTLINSYAESVLSGAGVATEDYPDGIPVAPDVLVGGLPDVWVGQGLGADVITFPDIMIDGSGVLAPDTSLEGEAAWDVAIDGVLEDLKTGELSWSDYWLDISDSVPVAKVEDSTTGDIVDRPVGDDGSLKDPVVVPDYSTDLNDYTLDLTGIFPFCIPFDLYNFLSCLAADPDAPKWTWSLPYLGSSYSFDVDLSAFDDVAQLFRNFELLLFIVGLGLKTRDLIKG